MKVVPIPAFTKDISPFGKCVELPEVSLVTQEIERNGRKVLVPVQKVVDHSELSEFDFRDFSILELQAAGKADNLRPASLIKQSVLAAYDSIESQSAVLIDTMDEDISSQLVKSAPGPAAEPAAEPVAEPAAK